MNPAKPQIPKWLILVIIVFGGITGYWGFTYSGPYRYLAELEMKWLGSYSPEATVLILALGAMLVVAAIMLVFRRPNKEMARRFRLLATNPSQIVAEVHTQMPSPWVRLRLMRFVGLAAFLGMGAWLFYNGTQAGSLQQLDAADFRNGKVRRGLLYAEVRGRLSEKYVNTSDYYLYIPMTSQDEAGTPVYLMVYVGEHQMRKFLRRESDGTFTVRGVTDKGLQGDVRYAFEKNGTKVADPVWVVHAGRNPEGDKAGGLIGIILGMVFAGILKVMENRWKRKRANEQPGLASVRLD